MTAAIVGVGQTAFSKASGTSETALVVEAVTAAVADAGLGLADVDGLVTFHLDDHDPLYLSTVLGLGELSWFSTTPWGGAMACATVHDAVVAVEHGLADVVVVYRAGNMRSGARVREAPTGGPVDPNFQWTLPFGLVMAAHMFALWGQRYLHERQVTNRDLAEVVVRQRDYAARNPNAHFHERPSSVEEHQASPWVVEPVLRIPDCCLETDGGVAIVVADPAVVATSSTPVHVRAAARGMSVGSKQLTNYYAAGDAMPDVPVVARQLWQQSGLALTDVDVVNVYDSFSPYVPMFLEQMGFCEPGRGLDLVRDGGTALDGPVPLNTNGGQLAEAYIHGFNGIVEVVRQLRGQAVNQVAGAVNGLAFGSPTMPTAALLLSREAP